MNAAPLPVMRREGARWSPHRGMTGDAPGGEYQGDEPGREPPREPRVRGGPGRRPHRRRRRAASPASEGPPVRRRLDVRCARLSYSCAPPYYGAEWKSAPVHPCRHVGPALALPTGVDFLHQYTIGDHPPSGVLAGSIITQGSDNLIRYPQSLIITSELMSQTELLCQHPRPSGHIDCVLILIILGTLSALKNECVHVELILEVHGQAEERLLSCTLLSTVENKRRRHDNEMRCIIAAYGSTNGQLRLRQVITPVKFTSMPHIHRQCIGKIRPLIVGDIHAK